MKSSTKHAARHMMKLVMATGLILMAGICPFANAQSCLNIADVPLDSLEQAAPGMIMFVVDDSGSMDWSFMTPPGQESSGLFSGNYYIFSNPGDDAYSADNLEDVASEKMMWMSQWSGYNGMYYDPATTYTPWPTLNDADIDNPQSNPMDSSNTLDMTATWQVWAEWGTIVDNADASGFEASTGWTLSGGGWNGDYLHPNAGTLIYSATWTASNLDPSTTYEVFARWLNGGESRLTNVRYRTHDDTVFLQETIENQQLNHEQWRSIAQKVTFPSGIGIVRIEEKTGNSGLCADAVKFVPVDNPVSDIARRHYYVQGSDGLIYLVNLLNGAIEYYRVDLDAPLDNRETVSASKLFRLTAAQAAAAGIVTGRTYTEECQNFANWYSFYRRRELTAKNAIANVINTIDGVYVGLVFINDYRSKDQAVLPVRVNQDGVFEDQSATLLDILYNYDISSYGTPLRNGLKKAGRYFKGEYMKPSTFSSQTSSDTYPFFNADRGGGCQQAFTILFSDGYYNGVSPGVGNDDGDNNTDFDGAPFGDGTSDTLADVAMNYFENDLNSTLDNDGAITQVDPADHQHMVTYTIAFGVSGSLDTELYKDCPTGTCPGTWPTTDTDSGKIDDMFHAAVNGRGRYLAANSTAELNEALQTLKNDISHRLGAAAALATNSIQLSVGSVVYQGIYNTANWYGEVSALPLSLTSGAVGTPIWRASDNIPDWDNRMILSYTGAAGIFFDAANLSPGQASQLTAGGLGSAEQLVNYIRGDTANSLSEGGSLRNRTHPLGDVVHSGPFYFKDVVYTGANDGMLHAFSAANGVELFAYVPNLVFDHLADLADPGYSHQYYVDGDTTAATIGNKDMLVGALGKGGKGYYALDVSSPTAMGASHVLWEYSDVDLGYSFSKASIIKTKAAGQVVVFGNGYDSVNGKAVLYVLELNDSLGIQAVHKFDTLVGGCNGMATPAAVDMEMDGYVDYLFAGDLKGNMWKIDLRGGGTADWKFAYMDGGTPKPLVTVKNTSGQTQPITAAPDVMLDCVVMDQGRGMMVVFGTGQFFNTNDFLDTTVQSFYGVWDWGDIWEARAGIDVAETKYLGTVDVDRSLTQLGDSVTLLEQSIVAASSGWGLLSDHQTDWYDPFAGEGSNMGWVLDMIDSGERSLREPMLRRGDAMLISTVPSVSACTAGGSSYVYWVSACSGGRTREPAFDATDDNKIDEDDKITFTGEPEPEPPSRKYVKKIILFDPIEISDEIYLPDDKGDINQLDAVDDPQGMFYWRVLGF